ncbi:Eco57I restriction-modification methylase domain-containing protein, partial [Pseudomonas aeruginosa]|nr:Eco57I restriction-modification methylase domain-containing protein [Pseudomonas aeruginosa]
ANPPYMGGKGMNPRLSTWAKENFPSSKSDLFAMFIERGFDLTPKFGYSAMVTMQSWMFLSSYEALRERILSETSIECMVHMANMVMGIAFCTS